MGNKELADFGSCPILAVGPDFGDFDAAKSPLSRRGMPQKGHFQKGGCRKNALYAKADAAKWG
ncbi:MAG: hypothetical protein KJ970_02380, partial [Candidatus Eisenbacteria bacterium]|nr:hypothetical protein [Candidatus Eisenbacteria bacterium]